MPIFNTFSGWGLIRESSGWEVKACKCTRINVFKIKTVPNWDHKDRLMSECTTTSLPCQRYNTHMQVPHKTFVPSHHRLDSHNLFSATKQLEIRNSTILHIQPFQIEQINFMQCKDSPGHHKQESSFLDVMLYMFPLAAPWQSGSLLEMLIVTYFHWQWSADKGKQRKGLL